MTWFNLILSILATYRLSRMIIIEAGPLGIFTNIRAVIASRYAADHWIAAGIACPLCVSFWIAAVFAALMAATPTNFILLWFGIAGAVTLIFLKLE